MSQTSFPKPLQQLADRYGIDNSSFIMAMMDLAYQAGEKHAWGESSQTPSLFMGEKVQMNLTFPELDQIWPVRKDDPVYELSQADSNCLRRLLSSEASYLQQMVEDLKNDEVCWYAKADKETQEGCQAFKELNRTRNQIRKIKKHQKRIDSIIRKLKYGA